MSSPSAPQYTQIDIDYRDLRIGRLVLNLESAQATVEQAKQLIKEREDLLSARDRLIEQHAARIIELEEIVEHLADDEDDEAEEGDD